MTQPCDHTSVGLIVFREGKLLLIDRKKEPFGYAEPAGHVDDHGDFEQAARAELREETGLTATALTLLFEGRKENQCRRPDGSWHYWRVYQAETEGEVATSDDEVKGHVWCTREELADLLADKGPEHLTAISREMFLELDIMNRFPH